MSESTFTLGESYTRQEIHEKVGGPVQGMLPTVKGEHNDARVVCCCIVRDFKPGGPKTLEIGDFTHQLPGAQQWARDRQSVPLFLKRQPSKWEYLGDFRVVKSTEGDDAAAFAQPNAVAQKVKLVLHLEPAPISD